jgi:hypothetical protein
MSYREKVLDMERRMGAIHLRVKDVCAGAYISNATWSNWKNRGVIPHPSTWLRVEAFIAAKEAENVLG